VVEYDPTEESGWRGRLMDSVAAERVARIKAAVQNERKFLAD
jgi:hypothetical protein